MQEEATRRGGGASLGTGTRSEDAGNFFGGEMTAAHVDHGADQVANHVVEKAVAADAVDEKHAGVGRALLPVGGGNRAVDVKKDFDDFRDSGYELYTDIRYRAIVTDSTTGRSEPRNFTVRLTHHPVHIYVRALGGNDREGDYMVSTSYADGEAVACKVTLDWMDENSHPTRAATATTDRYGLAKVHLRYPIQDSSEYDIRLTARDREGRTSIFDDRLHAEDADSIWISVGEFPAETRPADRGCAARAGGKHHRRGGVLRRWNTRPSAGADA